MFIATRSHGKSLLLSLIMDHDWYDTLISMNHTYMNVLPNTLQAGQLDPCMCHWPLPNSDYNITNDPRQTDAR